MAARTLPPDPPVREDGRCARPGCGKKRTITKQARKYAGEQVDMDPFCSADCCRAYHGVTWGRGDRLDDEEAA